MTAKEFRDRLVHIILQERLGNDTPPDVTEKVLTAAFAKHKLTLLRIACIALGAGLLAALVAWLVNL